MFLEIGKSYVKEFYSGNIDAAVKARDGLSWTLETIKAAFNFGNGTTADFKEYMQNNKKYSYFVEV